MRKIITLLISLLALTNSAIAERTEVEVVKFKFGLKLGNTDTNIYINFPSGIWGSIAGNITNQTDLWPILFWNSNSLINVSNSWYGSAAYSIFNIDTQRWNEAYTTATWASNNTLNLSNLVYSLPTNNWTLAYITALWASNNTVGLSNLVYALPTNNWNIAYNTALWASNNTFGVSNNLYSLPTNTWNTIASTVTTWSNSWNIAYDWVYFNSNALENGTSSWNSAYAISIWSSNNTLGLSNLVYALPTNNWNQVYIISQWASNNTLGLSNLVYALPTNNWNIAYDSSIWNSNGLVNISNSWYNSSAYLITSSDTQRWNSTYDIAVWSSNGLINLSNLVVNLPTNLWNDATNGYNIAVWASNGLVNISNLVYSLPTNNWNESYIISQWASNNTVGVSNRLPNRPMFMVTKGTNQLIPQAVYTKVTFTNIVNDSDNSYSTNNSRFTLYTDAMMVFNAQIHFLGAGAAQPGSISVYTNGVLWKERGQIMQTAGNNVANSINIITPATLFKSNDYIDIYAWIDGPAAGQTITSSVSRTWFSGYKINN